MCVPIASSPNIRHAHARTHFSSILGICLRRVSRRSVEASADSHALLNLATLLHIALALQSKAMCRLHAVPLVLRLLVVNHEVGLPMLIMVSEC